MGKKKYKLDTRILDQIDNELSAYLLGLLYADGSVTNKKRKKTLRFFQDKKDEDLLFLVRDAFKTDKPIHWSGSVGTVEICDTPLVYHIQKYGLVPNKTFLIKFPKIENSLIRHFIRGYLDGDGCICYGDTTLASVSFVSTKSFCETLVSIFVDLFDIKPYLGCRHPKRNNCIRNIQIGGILQVYKVLDWLYKDAQYFGDRKYKKFLDIQSYVQNSNRKSYRNRCLCLNPGEIFDSYAAAGKKFGILPGSIRQCCNGTIAKTHGLGFRKVLEDG